MRTFNTITGGVLAAAILQLASTSAFAAEPTVGLAMFSLYISKGQFNFETLDSKLKTAYDLGIRNVELFGAVIPATSQQAEELNGLLEKYEMQVETSHIGFDQFTDPTKLQAQIDFNKAIGNKYLVVPNLDVSIRPTSAAGWSAMGETLKSISEQLKANGQTLLYHNHAEELEIFDGKYALEIMLEAAGPDVKSELDLAWVGRAGLDPVDVLKRLHGRVHAVHAKDNIAGLEGVGMSGYNDLPESGFAAVGDGVLDWEKIIPAVYASGAELYLIEHDNPDDAAATIAKGLAFLKQNIHLRPDFRIEATNSNQEAVAAVINDMAPLSDVYSATYLADGGIDYALEQFAGSINASVQSVMVQDTQLLRNAINNRLRSAAEVMALSSAAPTDAQNYAFWMQGLGSKASYNHGALDRNVGGFLAGVDATVFDTWTVGLTGGYSRTTFDERNSSGSSNNYHFGIYAGTKMDAVSFRSGFGYTRHDIETDRSVGIAAMGTSSLYDSLSADRHGNTYQLFGELGYTLDAGKVSFEPYAGLAHVWSKTNSFTETGGAAALSSDGTSMNTTFSTLGLKAQTALNFGGVESVARGGLGWRHAFGDVDPSISQRFSDSDAFTVTGVPISKNVALIEAGLDFKLTPNATLGISYTGQFGSGERDNSGNARLSIKF